MNNGTLDFLLLYLDGFHLIEQGNLKFGKSILKATSSTITGPRITNPHKNAVRFKDF